MCKRLLSGVLWGGEKGNNVNLAFSGFQFLGHIITVAKIHPTQNEEQHKPFTEFPLFYHVLFLRKSIIGVMECANIRTFTGTSRSHSLWFFTTSSPSTGVKCAEEPDPSCGFCGDRAQPPAGAPLVWIQFALSLQNFVGTQESKKHYRTSVLGLVQPLRVVFQSKTQR